LARLLIGPSPAAGLLEAEDVRAAILSGCRSELIQEVKPDCFC
jgi:hypothetical protein